MRNDLRLIMDKHDEGHITQKVVTSCENSTQILMISPSTSNEMHSSLHKVVTSGRGDSGYGDFSDTDRSEGDRSRPSSGICESPEVGLSDTPFSNPDSETEQSTCKRHIKTSPPLNNSQIECNTTDLDESIKPCQNNVPIIDTPLEDVIKSLEETFVNTTDKSVASEKGKLDIAAALKTPRQSIHDENGIIRIDETDYWDEGELAFEPREVKIRKKKRVTSEYEMLEFLGRGKFGEVTKAKETSTEKTFAVKCVYAPTDQMVKDVMNEIDIMNSLQHPLLLQLHDAFQFKDEINLVLECILGGELFDRVLRDDFVLTERACVLFMRQICEGVQYIHSQNILHLDMKPENILCLTWTGTSIKIIDFGLARRKKPKEEMRVMFGTPEFMAPEVANYEPISTETDMWSVGVICYVLLSGLSPFMGPTDAETLGNVTKAEYDFNYKEFESISDQAKDFITKLLIPDKNKRISASECLQHEWLQRQKCAINPKQLSKKKLRGFVCRRKWQKAVNAILALKRMGVQL